MTDIKIIKEALIDVRAELWDEWHSGMSAKQFNNDWLIKEIDEALDALDRLEKKINDQN